MSDMVEHLAREMAEREGWRWDDDLQMLDQCAIGPMNSSRERNTWRNRARAAMGEDELRGRFDTALKGEAE